MKDQQEWLYQCIIFARLLISNTVAKDLKI